MGSMLKADICGMALCEEGFLAIADENAADGTTYRIQFKSGAHIQEAIKEIKSQFGLSDVSISVRDSIVFSLAPTKLTALPDSIPVLPW